MLEMFGAAGCGRPAQRAKQWKVAGGISLGFVDDAPIRAPLANSSPHTQLTLVRPIGPRHSNPPAGPPGAVELTVKARWDAMVRFVFQTKRRTFCRALESGRCKGRYWVRVASCWPRFSGQRPRTLVT